MINDIPSRAFTNCFWDKMMIGYTAAEAAATAASCLIWPWEPVKNYMFVGTSSTQLTHPSASREGDATLNLSAVNEFKHRLATNEWRAYQETDKITRYYRTINGCLTNDYYDVTYSGGEIVEIIHSGRYADKAVVLGTTLDMEYRSQIDTVLNERSDHEPGQYCAHTIYYLNNGVAIPIRIEFIEMTASNGDVYPETVCTDLNSGASIDYAEICTVDSAE